MFSGLVDYAARMLKNANISVAAKPKSLACSKCLCYSPTRIISGICYPCKRMSEKAMNPFKVGDVVMYTLKARRDGVVKYIACGHANCSYTNCPHPIKDKVWVQWPGSHILFSYMYTELDREINVTASTVKTPVMVAPTDKIPDFTIPKAPGVPKECAKSSFNWNAYNGVTQKSAGTEDKKPIQDGQVEWDYYHGFKKRKGQRAF